MLAQQQFANANNRELLKSQIENMFVTKIKTAMAVVPRPMCDGEQSYNQPIPESKAIQDTPLLSGAKVYRSWSRKRKDAM